jgi:CheY-like chemotaxis protein
MGAKAAKKLRIMVVNDTQEILELYRVLLEEEAGYDAVLLSYAPQEMAEIERVRPDLIVLDVIFGHEAKQGWQLLDKLKLSRATSHIPVVICTVAQAEVKEMEGYLAAHGVAVVLKPFDIDVFLAAVKQALALAPRVAANAAPAE